MSASDETLNKCGCCDNGPDPTPLTLENRPGLSEIRYRVGTHASFKAVLLHGIRGKPIFDLLTTRDDNDPTIALFDAAAMMLDVLTFYQERIANEGYLGTATERRSVLELARAIGYELNPGVAANTALAFIMQTSPGAPEKAVIPVGSKVMSIPGQNERPQTFETVAEITARPEWNALRPAHTGWDAPAFGDRRFFFQGTGHNLRKGDGVLLVGDERRGDITNDNWDFRRLTAVIEHPAVGNAPALTEVILERPLGSVTPWMEPARQNPRAYAMRLRANLFGYNAPDWKLMITDVREAYIASLPRGGGWSVNDVNWPQLSIQGIDSTDTETPNNYFIHLDNAYPAIQDESWVVLAKEDYEELYRVNEAKESSRAQFGISAKTTRLMVEGENLIGEFDEFVRSTTVFAVSEELPLAERPITEPLGGESVILDGFTGLAEGQMLLFTGKRIRLKLDASASGYELRPGFNMEPIALAPGESLIVLAPPVDRSASSKTWTLQHRSGVTGTLVIPNERVDYVPAEAGDPEVSEPAEIRAGLELLPGAALRAETWRLRPADPAQARDPNDKRLRVDLKAALTNLYDRVTVTINANVAPATHGETKEEILGSGNAARAFQRFLLKNRPLTYVAAPTPSGGESTLEVRVNDILWREVPSLYLAGPGERVFVTRIGDDGTVTVQFGDGYQGARLPSGGDNVRARFRAGTGAEGMVRAGQLSLFSGRPLGVQSVTNPLPATGGADPEALEDARDNAPFTVLTLDRIVSLQDFEDFVRAYAGIGKAQSADLWFRGRRVLHLTIAASVPIQTSQGEDYTVLPTSDLYRNLVEAIGKARDNTFPIHIDTYDPIFFQVQARLLVKADYLPEKVLAAAQDALTSAFQFSRRGFGQPVHQSEVMAVLQEVEGVQAVFLLKLCFQGEAPRVRQILAASRAELDAGGLHRAQLLLLDPLGIELEATTA